MEVINTLLLRNKLLSGVVERMARVVQVISPHPLTVVPMEGLGGVFWLRF